MTNMSFPFLVRCTVSTLCAYLVHIVHKLHLSFIAHLCTLHISASFQQNNEICDLSIARSIMFSACQ